MFNNNLRWKNICVEGTSFCVNLLASWLVFVHPFTKIWSSTNVMKFSTDSAGNWRWQLMSFMIRFSRPKPNFLISAIWLPHNKHWATVMGKASLIWCSSLCFTYLDSKVTRSLVRKLSPKAQLSTWRGLNRETSDFQWHTFTHRPLSPILMTSYKLI